MRATRGNPKLVTFLLGAFLVAACESVPELREPQSYSRDGISFRYPGNWSITEDMVRTGFPRFRYLSLESPGSATVIVTCHEPRLDLSVEEFAAEFHRKALEETEKLPLGPFEPFSAQTGKTVSVQSAVGGIPTHGVEQSFSISAGSQRLPHRFRAFKVESESATAFLLVQAADEDWDLVAPGFDLVLGSFQLE
jgi:hypothetical protein